MRTFVYESCVWLPRPLDEVFEFFADASNLEVITPPWLKFSVATPTPIEMRPGALIDYRLRFRGSSAAVAERDHGSGIRRTGSRTCR